MCVILFYAFEQMICRIGMSVGNCVWIPSLWLPSFWLGVEIFFKLFKVSDAVISFSCDDALHVCL